MISTTTQILITCTLYAPLVMGGVVYKVYNSISIYIFKLKKGNERQINKRASN